MAENADDVASSMGDTTTTSASQNGVGIPTISPGIQAAIDKIKEYAIAPLIDPPKEITVVSYISNFS